MGQVATPVLARGLTETRLMTSTVAASSDPRLVIAGTSQARRLFRAAR